MEENIGGNTCDRCGNNFLFALINLKIDEQKIINICNTCLNELTGKIYEAIRNGE